MDKNLRKDADKIIEKSIEAVLPDVAVKKALKDFKAGEGKVFLVAIGKAAFSMAKASLECLGNVDKGIVITKYDHVLGEIPGVDCFEAGHPVPDENGFKASRAVLDMVKNLCPDDTVLFLVSGGGSALFEVPLIPGEEIAAVTEELLACGADIVEINTIRKRLSGVKGGKFAKACEPARVFSIVLSDIIGDPLDMIASGPAYPDTSTAEDAKAIVKKYGLSLSKEAMDLLEEETPKALLNTKTHVTGSVRELCRAAFLECQKLGYDPVILTDELCCEAKEAGSFLASILKSHRDTDKNLAFIAGGETIVHLTGTGLGGRNQEISLGATKGIAGLLGTAVFSLGSDGTDGPCDAAGGYVDYSFMEAFKEKGIDVDSVLKNNDAYHALKAVDGLIITGPTGTNVNDVAVGLLKRR